jgi:hypothetical protein
LTDAGQGTDHRTEAAAVNEADLAHVQDDGAAVAQQPGNVRAQRFALATRNNPSVTTHDGDASDFASVE